MTAHTLIDQILQTQSRLKNECLPRTSDAFERNAVCKIEDELAEIAHQIQNNCLIPREKRYGEITRMVEEIDPEVIPFEIGKVLLKIERTYRSL